MHTYIYACINIFYTLLAIIHSVQYVMTTYSTLCTHKQKIL